MLRDFRRETALRARVRVVAVPTHAAHLGSLDLGNFLALLKVGRIVGHLEDTEVPVSRRRSGARLATGRALRVWKGLR